MAVAAVVVAAVAVVVVALAALALAAMAIVVVVVVLAADSWLQVVAADSGCTGSGCSGTLLSIPLSRAWIKSSI